MTFWLLVVLVMAIAVYNILVAAFCIDFIKAIEHGGKAYAFIFLAIGLVVGRYWG